MSDHVVQSCHGGDEMTEQAGQSCQSQSVWMSHWMSATCKSSKQACSRLLIHYKSQEDDHEAKLNLCGSEMVRSSSKYGKGFSEVTESKTLNIIDEDLIARTDRVRSERLNYQPFPMFNLHRKGESVLARTKEQASISNGLQLRSQIDLNSENHLVSLGRSESHIPTMLQWSLDDSLGPKCSSQCPKLEVKHDKIIENNSLASIKPFKDNLIESSSKAMPYGFNRRRTPLQSMCIEEETNQPNSILESLEQGTKTFYHNNSMCLICERTDNSSGRLRNSLLRQNDVTLSLHDPSTSSNQLPEFVSLQCHKMQDHFGSSHKNSPMESTNSEKMYLGCHSLPSVPRSVRDTEATLDSMKESSKGPTKFSPTTHHLLFTKNIDISSEGGQMLEQSTVSTRLKGRTPPALFGLCPEFGLPVQSGVKLQLLGSSTTSEGDKNDEEFKTTTVNLTNESSADTNTMDLDTCRENHVSGVVSSLLNEHIELEQQSPTSRAALAPASEIGGKLPKTKLPDMNKEIPDLAAYESSAEERETSTSRTQSLDAEHLLSNAEQPPSVDSVACLFGFPESEPHSRWVKRLKLSPTSASGAKSTGMGEDTSHEKVNKLFSKIIKCSVASTELRAGRLHGKEQMELNNTAMVLRNGESSPVDSMKESRDITLSHPWIRRWCHNTAISPLKKSKAVVDSEPQCSKERADRCQKKQFPSLAAMALMGKAMSGLGPCEISKKGSSVVWSS